MPAFSRYDIRRALALELAISDALGDLSQVAGNQDSAPNAAAFEASRARVAALRMLLKHVPDDEVIDPVY